MNLNEFRLLHSQLIEHYQFIERELEDTFAAVSGEPFMNGLEDVASDNIPKLVKRIHAQEKKKGESFLTKDECKRISTACKRRNYWCHNCYVDMVFSSKTGGPKKEADIQTLLDDLKEAEDLRGLLFTRKSELMKRFDIAHKMLSVDEMFFRRAKDKNKKE